MYLNIDLLLFFFRNTNNQASDQQSGRPISNRTDQSAIVQSNQQSYSPISNQRDCNWKYWAAILVLDWTKVRFWKVCCLLRTWLESSCTTACAHCLSPLWIAFIFSQVSHSFYNVFLSNLRSSWELYNCVFLEGFRSYKLACVSLKELEHKEFKKHLWKWIVSLTQADDPDILFGTTKLLRRIYYHCGGE